MPVLCIDIPNGLDDDRPLQFAVLGAVGGALNYQAMSDVQSARSEFYEIYVSTPVGQDRYVVENGVLMKNGQPYTP